MHMSVCLSRRNGNSKAVGSDGGRWREKDREREKKKAHECIMYIYMYKVLAASLRTESELFAKRAGAVIVGRRRRQRKLSSTRQLRPRLPRPFSFLLQTDLFSCFSLRRRRRTRHRAAWLQLKPTPGAGKYQGKKPTYASHVVVTISGELGGDTYSPSPYRCLREEEGKLAWTGLVCE